MSLLQRIRMANDRGLTVANLLDELLRRTGDRQISEGDEGPFQLSDLHASVCSIDAFLRDEIRLQPGQQVAIYRSNHRVCFHWFVAIVRAGGIAIPLNPQLQANEVRRILAESGTEIVVTDRAVFERHIHDREALPARVWIQSGDEPETLEGFLRCDEAGVARTGNYAPVTIDPTATIAVFFTSGTSGFPKGAALSSNALLGGRAATVFSGLILGRRDLALIALPWSHIMAVSIVLNGMIAGVRGCFLDRFDVTKALSLVERFGVTAMVGVPAMFAQLVNSEPDPARLKTIRLWLSASDHLPSEVRERMRGYGALTRLPFGLRLSPLLLNGYGMVELGGLAMMGVELSFLPGSGDFCWPVPPFQIRVVDEAGKEVPAGAAGECQIRSRGLRPHYFRHENPELLSADGWLRTGDLATRNRMGFVRLVGRMKDVIKSGGYSVYARELEEAVMAHPAVAKAAAFGLPHKEKGEIPAAAVELHTGSTVSEGDLLAFCREHLAAYKSPRRIWIFDPGGLPQNANGKTLRRALKERFSAEMG